MTTHNGLSHNALSKKRLCNKFPYQQNFYSSSSFFTSTGLTLIELITVVAIAAILVSVAIPSFNTLYRTSQANAAVLSAKQMLTLARITALEQGKPITLCPSQNSKQCSTDWNQPVITFKDTNNNQIIDGSETLLKITSLPSTYTLQWAAFGNKNYITYSPLGTINHTNGSLSLCPTDKNSRYGKLLVINKGGRIRSALDTDNSGVVNRASGEDLECS